MKSVMTQSSANRLTEPELGYRQLFAALIRQKFWFLGTFATAVLGALLFTLTQESLYESSMRLIVEPNYREEYDPAEEQGASDRQQESDYFTQLNLMQGTDLLQRAAETLEPIYPELTAADISEDLLIRQVQENGVETRIVSVSYTDTQPERAQRVLEALELVYQDYALEQQDQRLKQGLEVINNQIKNAQKSLTDSQTELRDFRQDQNLIDPQQQAEALTNNLNQVSQQQYAQQEQLQSAIAQYETLRQQINLSPDEAFRAARLSQSPRFQSLLNALQETELQLAERQTVYLETEPGVQILIEKRQNQARLLAEEAGRVLGPDAAGLSGGNFQGFGQLSTLDLDLVKALAEAQAQIESLSASGQSLDQSEQEIQAQLSQFPGLISSYDRLQPEITTEQTVLQQLLTQRELLSAELARGGGFRWQLISSPQLGRETGPLLKRNLLLGAVLGLFLGGLAAFIRESIDTVIRTPEDLQRYNRLPLLGVIPPHSISGDLFSARRLPWASDRRGNTDLDEQSALAEAVLLPVQESLDLIFKGIQRRLSSVQKALVVTSVLPSEEKVSFGLATSSARLGHKVVYIEANLRNPQLGELLPLSDAGGLSSFLAGRTSTVDLVSINVSGTTLDVLPAGAIAHDPIGLLASKRFKALIGQMEKQYDYVFVEAPVVGTADILEIASVCHAVIAIADLHKISQADLQTSIQTLDEVNAIGLIANNPGNVNEIYRTVSHVPSANSHVPSVNDVTITASS